MEITCQYTGIVFEATSKRQKNHPRVSALLNDAAKAGPAAYGTAKERLEEARQAGMTDIGEIIAFVRTGAMHAQAQFDRRVADDRQARKEAAKEAAKEARHRRNEREHTNGILRAGGYRWIKEDEESMDAFGAGAFQAIYGNRDYVWLLIDNDGRKVSVHQAMQEMAARGNELAQQWLADRKES